MTKLNALWTTVLWCLAHQLAAANADSVHAGSSEASYRAYRSDLKNIATRLLAPAAQYKHINYGARGLSMQGDKLMDLASLVENVVDAGLQGDVYETGIWRGGTSIFMVQNLMTDGPIWQYYLLWQCYCGNTTTAALTFMFLFTGTSFREV